MNGIQAAAEPIVGVPVGLLIGVLSGAVFMIFIGAARTAVSIADGLKVIAQAGTILGLWFGGSWLNSQFFEPGDATRIRGAYLASQTRPPAAGLSNPGDLPRLSMALQVRYGAPAAAAITSGNALRLIRSCWQGAPTRS